MKTSVKYSAGNNISTEKLYSAKNLNAIFIKKIETPGLMKCDMPP